MTIDSENEAWLLRKLERLIGKTFTEKENENTTACVSTYYLRVVGTVCMDSGIPVTIRLVSRVME